MSIMSNPPPATVAKGSPANFFKHLASLTARSLENLPNSENIKYSRLQLDDYCPSTSAVCFNNNPNINIKKAESSYCQNSEFDNPKLRTRKRLKTVDSLSSALMIEAKNASAICKPLEEKNKESSEGETMTKQRVSPKLVPHRTHWEEYEDFFMPTINILSVPLNYSSSVSKDPPGIRIHVLEDYVQVQADDKAVFKRPRTPPATPADRQSTSLSSNSGASPSSSIANALLTTAATTVQGKGDDEAVSRYQTMLKIKRAKKQRFYTCSYCLLFFNDSAIHKIHTTLHNPTNVWKCGLCGMDCKNRLYFNVHIVAAQHEPNITK